MKEYMKPEVKIVVFSTEAIADVDQDTTSGDGFEDIN